MFLTYSIRHRRAFSLIEMLTVLMIIVMLAALLLPAIQRVREASSKIKCSNNMKQLTLGCHTYHDSVGSLPYGRKYDLFNSYCWSILILPYIEQGGVYAGYASSVAMSGFVQSYNVNGTQTGPNGPIGSNPDLRAARHTKLPTFVCPSDRGATANEMGTSAYGARRGNYRGCTSAGDMYGDTDSLPGPLGLGAFGVLHDQSFDKSGAKRLGCELTSITDGASQTLLLSEGLVVGDTSGWGGPIGMHIYGNMGGALFTASITPNSTLPDRPYGPCPSTSMDPGYPTGICLTLGGGNQWWYTGAIGSYTGARSKHRNGVWASMADGSVRFMSNTTDSYAWRSMGTRSGGETFVLQ